MISLSYSSDVIQRIKLFHIHEQNAKSVFSESILKNRKIQEEWAFVKKQEVEATKKNRSEIRKLIYNRDKQFAKEYTIWMMNFRRAF